MYELLLQKVNELVNLTEDEFELCKTLFIPKKLRKRQYLLQEGDICKHVAFVEKGMTKTYSVDEKGNEHILQFSPEGWWVADMYSFFSGEPSTYHIEALEDCELLLITRPSYEQLLDKVPKFERYFRILVQNNLVATQRRLMGSMSESAEERYQKLMQAFPACLQRVPQHMIASYLGITRETLSRIRKQMAEKR